MELVGGSGRLDSARLADLPAHVARPGYDRSALRIGIVHVGLGAFARAHLAAVNDAALRAGAAPDWGICGVSLRQADTRDALAPQDGLYALALCDADGGGAPRQRVGVIGCLRETLVAPEDPGAVLTRIAAPDTRIVSVTVTEKGYCHDPASGRLDLAHPDIAHDLANPASPRGLIGFLAYGLQRRRAAGLAPLTVMSLDNLPANGRLLRALLLTFAARVDADLAGWIAAACAFPCSMVDRIVPRTTDADRQTIATTLGVRDAWPVVAEPYLEWVVEDRFVAGRPDWTAGGARFVRDAAPFEALKLRMVNGAHSALAYLSVMAGWATVDAAMAQPGMLRFLGELMRREIEPTLPPLPGLDPAQYRRALLQRFANPALRHQTRQIAMDGSQKLPQRLLGTVRDRLAADGTISGLALAVAGWLHYLRGSGEDGCAYEIQDPMAGELARWHARAQEMARLAGERQAGEVSPCDASMVDVSPDDAMLVWARAMTAWEPVFGDLGQDPRFVQAVARAAQSLRRLGVAGALAAVYPSGPS